MSTVMSLGYLRLTAPDLDAWRGYATDLLGLQVADDVGNAVGDGALYLKQDERSHRVVLEPGDEPKATFGWEVAHRAALETVAARLDAAGVAVKEATADHAEQRQVTGMLLCDDPAGNLCEIFYGAKCDKEAFVSPTGARFTTGDMGLGHAFMLVPDGKAFESFYGMLGFRVSDYIDLAPGMQATFLHCNARHHSLAFLEVPGTSAVQHVMLEVDDVDTVGRSWDKCVAGAAPVVMTLGKHTNDEMFSFYSASPSGVVIEYGTGGIQVDDDTWTVQTYDAPSYWGHVMQGPPPAPAT